MNKFYLILNIVLLAAVGFLYYAFYSENKGHLNSAGKSNAKISDSLSNSSRIAFVELDSLNEHLVYFKQRRKELEQQQKQVEADITSDYKNLENKSNSFQQKNPNATPEEIQNIRAQLGKMQQDIENKKQNQSQILNQKSFELMESIQKNLKEFLADYNKQKKYQLILTTGGGLDYLIYKDSTLDITRDVIVGMNEKMKLPVKK